MVGGRVGGGQVGYNEVIVKMQKNRGGGVRSGRGWRWSRGGGWSIGRGLVGSNVGGRG